ncbi:MAG: M20/M25/M40 family metallo-hydrolase [Chloroflexi bacterium]|nr:M20/M25/M40 family metallo-hydrolase [Chloroflexota bacterium]
MQDIYQYIEQHREEYIARAQQLVRQSSVAAQGVGVQEASGIVMAMLASVGAQVERLETRGQPVVFGELNTGAARTLSIYNHYDVQPAEPLELWHHDPWGAEIADGKIFGRGIGDDKGDFVARVCAIDAIQHVRGQVGANLKFVVEGEEEIGSPNLEHFAREHQKRLKADACLWEGGGKNANEIPEIALGVKGIAYFQLSVQSANTDLHSALAAIIPNAAWRLTWALGTLKDQNERVRIKGFYDDVRRPSPSDHAALKKIKSSANRMKKLWGFKNYLLNLQGAPLQERLTFQPTCTICGIWGGYQGSGLKTVLPKEAFAKVDFRLVPDQDPAKVARLLRTHLDAHGFRDVKIELLGGEHPSRTPMDSPFAKVCVEAASDVWGVAPAVVPMVAGSGPMYPLGEKLGIPTVMPAGIGYAGMNIHAPNENVRVEDYIAGIKYFATIFERFGREP